jgi:pyrroloquinoline quinone biosynthesis protein B
MRIRLLGTAAGGGVPQWNCNCQICREARTHTGGVKYRTQSSVAISADEKNWFLLNASPDLRAQTEAFAPLHPPTDKTRGSPIQAVLLTNADLDHTLGVFLLREGENIAIYASAAVRESLEAGLGFTNLLSAFCGVTWVNSPLELSALPNRDGSESSLLYRMIPLGGKPPRFSRKNLAEPGHVNAYQIVDKRTRGRLLYLPDMPALMKKLKSCSVTAMFCYWMGHFGLKMK